MAEHYSRHSKSTTQRHHKDKDSMKSKARRTNYSDCKYYQGSKTPPLPTRSTSSLEDLIKQRESLKHELKKIVKCTSSEINKTSRKRTHSKEDSSYDKNIKGHQKNERIRGKSLNKRKFIHEASPELENTHVESEDEETIIELRRQQRKQLLEKLNESADKSSESNDETQYKSIHFEDKNTKSINAKHSSLDITKQVTDMFSEKDEFENKTEKDSVTQSNNESISNLTDNWDDQDGYYNVRVGDIVNNRYVIKGLLGQGVFANVVRAQDNMEGNDYVAIKIVRNNDLMYRTSLKEITILKQLSEADPDNKYHCVKFLGQFMHKNHLCILLESLHMDLRCVIKKYGKHHGINMKALNSYTRQLLLALRLLKKIGIVHADIKPDNILVNEKKNILKLCDFGSAGKLDDNEPTPYLVSRFYRAPEIILGVPYKHGVDVWSAACTIYEMATGKIMFTGNSNNKMLKCFMDMKGKFSSKLIKKGKFKDQHFNYNHNFLLHKKDEFTGREKLVEMSNINVTRDLLHELKKSFKNPTSNQDKKITQLKDLIDKMTMLDSSQRLPVTDCLRHPFILEELSTEA